MRPGITSNYAVEWSAAGGKAPRGRPNDLELAADLATFSGACTEKSIPRERRADDNVVLRHNVDRAVVLDVHDAAAHRLPVGQVDEDVVAGPPAWLGLIHIDQNAPAASPGLGPRPGPADHVEDA